MEAPETDSTYIDILKKHSKLDESDDEIAGRSPRNLKVFKDSDDEDLSEDLPKKSKKVIDSDFDDDAGPSKSNLVDFDDSKRNKKSDKKSKSLKKPLKPTGSSKDLLDL